MTKMDFLIITLEVVLGVGIALTIARSNFYTLRDELNSSLQKMDNTFDNKLDWKVKDAKGQIYTQLASLKEEIKSISHPQNPSQKKEEEAPLQVKKIR